MNEKKFFLQLAEEYKENPDEFVNLIEKSPFSKGDIFFNIGTSLLKISYFILAITLLERALNYSIKNDNKKMVSLCYNNLGAAYYGLKKFDKSISYYEKSLLIAKEIKDKNIEFKCYGNFGAVFKDLRDFKKSIECYDQCLELIQEINDKTSEFRCYIELGIVYFKLMDFKNAIENYEKSLIIAKEIEDIQGIYKCYTNLGIVYKDLGDLNKSIEYHEKSLIIAKEIEDIQGIYKCYTNLGIVYKDLGDLNKSIEYHEKSLKIAKEIGCKSDESNIYTNLGIVYNDLGNFLKSIEYHEKSLIIAKEIEDMQGISTCYGNLGAVYHNLGNFLKSIEYHEKSLKIAKEIKDKKVESNCYGNLGIVFRDLGYLKISIEFLDRYLEINKEINNKIGESRCYTELGVSYERLDDNEKAIEYLKHSIKINEKIKQDFSLEELRMFFHGKNVQVYDELSFVYLKKDEIEMSINTLDYSKNRELNDMIFCAESLCVNPTYGHEYNQLIKLRSEIKNQIDIFASWENETKKANIIFKDDEIVEKIKTFENEKNAVNKEYNRVSKQIQNLHDKVNGLKSRDYNILSNALNVLKNKDNWLLMEYLIMPSQSKMVVFFIGKDEIQPVSAEYDRKKLDSLITNYIYSISAFKKNSQKSESKLRELSSEFYNTLFPGKIDEQFKEISSNVNNLMIIPHKYQLHMVPWEILFDGNDHLGLKFSLSNNFSLDLAISAIQKEKSSGSSALLVKNPKMDLDWADKEVNVLKEILTDHYETNILEHEKATTNNFKNKIKNQLDILHFSGHGYFATNPGLSGLVFNDNYMTANQISGLKFNGSPIVSLSACESGINHPIRGDELMGLLRGFITAGSPSIISTNWRVYDKSAYELMIKFYNGILNENPKSIGVALRDARKHVFDKYNGEIIHWGPFKLYGDQFRKMVKPIN